ncbi:MAG TPA: signal peptidase I [bacterium]|jgi:signal peptidase I|nr:signal peptidase I [bacterium]HOG38368.1 signal peptidase I [bacterium]HQI03613.1 signal peptidase I [bacterium]
MKNKNQNLEYINEGEDVNFDNLPQPNKWRERISFVLEIVKTVIISLAIILPIRYFLIQPFMVDGASMEPNFYNADYLIIDEISYRFKVPERGDVVVFKNPENTKEYFIKRVIGLPGETIKIQDGKVFLKNINSGEFEQIQEDYLPVNLQTIGVGRDIIIPDNHYFVLGDNRSNSRDSRYFGAISEDLITGKVLLRGYPFNRIKLFTGDKQY